MFWGEDTLVDKIRRSEY